MKPLRQVHSTDRVLQQIQTALKDYTTQLNGVQILDGQLLENVSLAVGANSIDHKLGRVLNGWFIVRKSAAGDVYDTQDSNSNKNRTLQLVSSAAMTVSIWVF